MPSPTVLEKARLVELDADFETNKPGGRTVFVQFNPESLKLTLANQIQQPPGGGNAATLFVGAGSSKLALQLWFDVTAPIDDRALPPEWRGQAANRADDVRKLTEAVAYFLLPHDGNDKKNPALKLPPAVGFLWGTFQFNGLVESLDESLEFFSPQGKPLRAALSLSITRPRISPFKFATPVGRPAGASGAASAGAPQPGLGSGAGAGIDGPGGRPLAAAAVGASLQGMVAAAGLGSRWQAVASANGIENPRLLAPGQLVDLSLGASAGASFSAGFSAGTGVALGFSAGGL